MNKEDFSIGDIVQFYYINITHEPVEGYGIVVITNKCNMNVLCLKTKEIYIGVSYQLSKIISKVV